MAVVIPFEPRPRPPAADDAPRAGEILFFTGIRYERMPEPARPTTRETRRRDSSRNARSRQPA